MALILQTWTQMRAMLAQLVIEYIQIESLFWAFLHLSTNRSFVTFTCRSNSFIRSLFGLVLQKGLLQH